MRVDLDAKVQTRDGEEIGSVNRAVVDPRTSEVTHLVVSTGAILGRDVLVPREEVEQASDEGDTIRLRLSKTEVDDLPSYVADNYVAPPPTWIAPVGYGFPAAGYVWPVAYSAGATPGVAEPSASDDNLDEVSLKKGALVLDRDGDDVGVVDEVRFDATSGRIRGFVLRVGGALQTLFGGGDTLELSSTHIARVADDIVTLQITKHELERTADRLP